jgi:tetratricopeptide (TPR) repeat protein
MMVNVRGGVALLWLWGSLAMVGLNPSMARAETGIKPLVEETGTITPAEAVHRFSGKEGDIVTIILESQAFDPVLSLRNSAQEEIASNDDFGGSLNATIIIKLPATDTYTVVSRSFEGNGGDYRILVRSATDYEVLYAEAEALVADQRYGEAIAAYTQAIDRSPEQIPAYLGRIQAHLTQLSNDPSLVVNDPADIPPAVRQAVIADLEKAASLIEGQGSPEWADTLRQQAEVLRNGNP